MDTKLLFNQIKLQLPNMEGVAIKMEDNKMNFYVDGRLEFYVRESGGISFVPECSYTDKVKDISEATINTSNYVRGYLKTIEEAPAFQVEGFKKDYKLLARFNDTILAGRVMCNDNIEFITWDKDPTGVSGGRYFGNNFIAAKESFAVRADIVNRDKIFTAGELVEIYRCVEDTLSGGYELTVEQEETLEYIKDKIKETVPELEQLLSQEVEEFGQTMQ